MLITLNDLIQYDFVYKYYIVSGNNKLNNSISAIFPYVTPEEEWINDSIYIIDLCNCNINENNIIFYMKKFHDTNMSIVSIGPNDSDIKNNKLMSLISQNANLFNVPVISIESNRSFSYITSFLINKISKSYSNEVKISREIYSKFSYLALKGKGLNAIIEYFKEVIGNPVAVYDIDNKCIASTDKFLDNTFELNSTSTRENLNNLYYLKQKITLNNLRSKSNETTQILFPITFEDKIRAYLSVFEIERTLDNVDFFILEVAATATLIEMKKRIAMRTMEQRFINDLIYDLINNNIDNEEIVYERSKLIGLNFEDKYIVILFEIEVTSDFSIKNHGIEFETNQDKIFSFVSKKIYYANHYCVIGRLSNSIIAIWPTNNDNYDKVSEELKTTCNTILNDTKKKFNNQAMMIGIGKPCENLKTIHKSYKEAKDAIVIGSTIYGKDAIIGFKDLGILRLISKVESRSSLMEIIPETLIELKKHDKLYNTQLLETLRVYLECNGNASKAAQELFIHYKTMLYRLERVVKTCEIDLENYHSRLELGIGIKILNLLDNKNFDTI
jgi:PucR family transcriptional regulator, purine catabolism regulatory protein